MNQKGFANIIVIIGIIILIGVVGYFVVNQQVSSPEPTSPPTSIPVPTPTPTPQSSPSPEPSPVSTLISWDEAIKVLNSGKVKRIFQAHSLEVTLTLKDGKVLKTKAPKIDVVWEEVRRCGTVCEGIGRSIE